MVSDPYLALHLPHTATDEQIKRSYHELARRHHPDRFVSASDDEKDAATQRFAKIAQAYELLSDARRKAEYDHIYKYGGYDDDEQEEKKTDRAGVYVPRPSNTTQSTTHGAGRKRRNTGIGYTCADPLAFLWTRGQVQSKISHCGVQIPSRLHMAQPNSGLAFGFSSSQYMHSPTSGNRTYMSTATRFVNGKKYTKTETTICYPDGRKEVIIQGDDYLERRFEPAPAQTHCMNQQDPWYIGAWHGLKDRLTMCYSPSAAVAI